MKKWFICAALMMILSITAACGDSAQPGSTPAPAGENEIIGTVNGQNIYRYEYDFYFNMYFEESFNNYYESLKMVQGVDMLEEESAKPFLANLENYAWDSTVNAELIRQMAAEDYGVSLEPNYTDELLLPAYSLALTTNRLYMEIFPFIKDEAILGKSISEEEARATYDSDPAAWDSRRVAHIIIIPEDGSEKAKADAKAQIDEVLAKLKAGADFAEMAKEYSQDGAAASGGEMDLYFNRAGGGVSQVTSFDATFAEAAFQLAKIGDFSQEPVETTFGYHIIKLLDEKAGFDAAREYVLQGNDTISDEDVSAFFGEKLQERLAASTVERQLEFKYYDPEGVANPEETESPE